MSAIVGARNADQLKASIPVADLQIGTKVMDTLTAASAPTPSAYPDGAFGSAQRDRTTNDPEALGAVVKAFAEDVAD